MYRKFEISFEFGTINVDGSIPNLFKYLLKGNDNFFRFLAAHVLNIDPSYLNFGD